MDWQGIRAEYTELGRTWPVGRPALVMDFYGDGPKMATHGEPLLDRCLELLPANTELYVLGNNDRQYKKVTPHSMRRIRMTLRELDQKGRFYSFKNAPEFEVGSVSFEFELGAKQSMANDSVRIALPLSCGASDQVERTLGWFSGFATDFPFWGGISAYSFDFVWGREFEQAALPLMFKTARRFRGLIVRERCHVMLHQLPTGGWLTFLDEALLARVGGEDALRGSVGNSVSMLRLRDGVVLRAGTEPPVGDVNRQEKDFEPLAAVTRALKPVRRTQWLGWNLFGVEREEANAWFARFD